jgi:hypothetical protein
VIWLARTSNCSASSANIFSPEIAAKATLALNAAEWFLGGRLLIGAPLLSHLRLKRTEPPLIRLPEFAEPALAKVVILCS